jgi:Fe-S-cluster containining protein
MSRFCRANCGACCTHISISSALPGHPNGKVAGVTCINLNTDNNCSLYGDISFPDICKRFMGDEEMCGSSVQEAVIRIQRLEMLTSV